MFELKVSVVIEAAHRLKGHKGKCDSLHGHTFKFDIYAIAKEQNEIGITVDFEDLDQVAQEIIMPMDHCYLNEYRPLKGQAPSAENLARYAYNELKEPYKNIGATLKKVRVHEGNVCVSYPYEERFE